MNTMEQLISGFAVQMRNAHQKFKDKPKAKGILPIHHVVLAGLGGSGIGGNIVQSILFGHIKVPFEVIKHYDIPAYVGPNTLFIASSFSGNTEETLEATEKAQLAGAQIVCVASGGKIQKLAEEKGYDIYLLDSLAPCPRAHLPTSVTALLHLFEHYGLITEGFTSVLLDVAAFLEAESDAIRAETKKLAPKLAQSFVFLYGSDYCAAVLVRLQQQINENAKQICHVGIVPEMNHNEFVGWVFPADVLKKSLVLQFHLAADHPRVSSRFDICKPFIAKASGQILDVKARGDHDLKQLFYFILWGDWLSFELAAQNNVDPYPVSVIDTLKKSLENV
ncbi:MAG: bifunctional phosphoglucose/phosphomannose isomerase [Cytophagales bacterium]|nr:MAG: bifunctional phosphoglucose/phosphomannose isomerase [Cytophagales bacterium]TAF59306.1 MAG: bifunctional phosphoglucose/phosphomannose isomerase [Cytophagales bacterium]